MEEARWLLREANNSIVKMQAAGDVLSKAEWTVLAHFVQQGLEAFSGDTPNPVSRESLIEVLDAFLAGYELRKGASVWDEYYLGNLPADCRPGKSKGSEGVEKATPKIVRRTVQETRRWVGEPATKYAPLLVGRNVYALLEEEKLSGADTSFEWPKLDSLDGDGSATLDP